MKRKSLIYKYQSTLIMRTFSVQNVLRSIRTGGAKKHHPLSPSVFVSSNFHFKYQPTRYLMQPVEEFSNFILNLVGFSDLIRRKNPYNCRRYEAKVY